MRLILGGSGSGKSAYAEKMVCDLAGKQNLPLYYLATMQVSDAESVKKVERHRKMRSGKAFHTIEQPRQIKEAAPQVKEAVVLLECLSNLVANELFSPKKEPGINLTEKILADVRGIAQSANDLVIVSNNVFEDGITYDSMTEQYIQILGELNQQLAKEAELAVEVVYGIPVVLSGKEEPCPY
ncbi:MAG: bifunctional adenosylcobinamide kinase/adenosylcobinamide-phosphate guanylyltransferase [Lachnospiraceae bacterium]